MSSQTIAKTVDQSFVVAGTLSGDMNDTDVDLSTSGSRADTNWSVGASSITYTGTPDHVILTGFAISDRGATSNALQRITPRLTVLRNGTVELGAVQDYSREATGQSSNLNNVTVIDSDPGTNPSYSYRTTNASNQGDVLTADAESSFKAIAIEKVQV